MDYRLFEALGKLDAFLALHRPEHHTALMTQTLLSLRQTLERNPINTGACRTLFEELGWEAARLKDLQGGIEFRDTLSQLRTLLLLTGPDAADAACCQPSYFLSYAVASATEADDFERHMNELGRTIWRDKSGIPLGADHRDVIGSQIDTLTTFVALYGTAYRKSVYCMGELSHAMSRPRRGVSLGRIVMLRLDNEPLPYDVSARNFGWARTSTEREQVAKRLVEEE